MQIEGTPNERAILVAFAYVAGFTAAFIAFGLTITSPSVSTTFVQVPEVTQTAAVSSVTSVASEQVRDEVVPDPVSTIATEYQVRYENKGLYLYTDAELPTLLSKDAQVAGFVYDDSGRQIQNQGFHTAVPHYEYFSALGHVFFCEQYDVTGTCTPYLYNTDTQQLYVFMTEDGEIIEIDNRDAQQVVVTSAGSYVLGSYRSSSVSDPWVVVPR